MAADGAGGKVHDLDAQRGAKPPEADGDDEPPEEAQEEFPMGLFEPSDAKTIKTLIASGLPVELTVSLGAAEIPLRGGIPDPNKLHRLLITSRFHKAEPIAQYDSDDDTKIVGWKIRVHMKSRHVEVVSDEAAAAASG